MSNSNAPSNVSFDPGWNDPPKLAYNTQQVVPSKPRNLLNKRVAFPMSGSCLTKNATSMPASQIVLPPLPVGTMPAPPVHSNPRTLLIENDIDLDSEKALTEVMDILVRLLNECGELGTKASDIKRRIDMMEVMWASGKLNSTIKAQMLKLSYALRDDLPSKADEIHRALMVDHVSAVGSWMPGIKQLIYHCLARSELLAIDKDI